MSGLAERRREEWELDNFREGEIAEMIALYQQKGIERADAEMMVNKMAEYPDFFVDIMMQQELELQIPSEDDNPWKDGLVTFLSFVFFGTFPLVGYVLFSSSTWSASALFMVSSILTAVMLFILGALKTKFSNRKWYWGGMEILVMGSFTAAVAYWIGWFVENVALGGQKVS